MFKIANFYHFVHLPCYEDMKQPLLECCIKLNLKGTILLALEGINCSIAGLEAEVEEFIKFVSQNDKLNSIFVQYHCADFVPFDKMKVRLKNELVGLKLPQEFPSCVAESTIMIEPKNWNKIICDQDISVIDLRNKYETAFGTFKGAISPETNNFRDFPEWVANWKTHNKCSAIAVYCTGGIRCEKIITYVNQIGFKPVYQLKGGVINYFRHLQCSNMLSTWIGECFVFDNRAAIDVNCIPTANSICNFCNQPISAQDRRWVSKRSITCESCIE